MPEDLAQLLRAETGAGDRFQIAVVGNGETAPKVHEFKFPYAVVGRGEGCDIVLPAHQVSFRHAYFQVIEGQVFCVDLASRNGVFWPDGPRKFGWLAPGEQAGRRIHLDQARLPAVLAARLLRPHQGPSLGLRPRMESARQPQGQEARRITDLTSAASASRRGRSHSRRRNQMPDLAHIEDMIANSEPLESFELDDYTDQEEVLHALQEMLDRELY